MKSILSHLFTCVFGFVLRIWSYALHWLSFEFLLTRLKRANGGDVILLRALVIAMEFYAIAIVLGLFDSSGGLTLSWNAFWTELPKHSQWFGPIIAAVYAALYARFASQWSYLANLYNQIKGSEIRLLTSIAEKKITKGNADKVAEKLAEWKAGFVEDAENLHLATKNSIAAIIWFWLKVPEVRDAYEKGTPGGERRYQPLMDAVSEVTNRLGGIKEYEK